MRQDFRAVTINIDQELYDQLEKLKTTKKPSLSFIVREILQDYFKKDIIVEPIGETINDVGFVVPNPVEIRIAERLKRMGKEYNKDLERYFTNA